MTNERNQRLRSYGANPEFFDTLRDFNPVCPICFSHIGRDVDHDHRTRTPRGMVCRRCNSILGFARDSAQILENAARYLRVSREASMRKQPAIVIGPCPDLPEPWVSSGQIILLIPPVRSHTDEWPSSLTSRLDRRYATLGPEAEDAGNLPDLGDSKEVTKA